MFSTCTGPGQCCLPVLDLLTLLLHFVPCAFLSHEGEPGVSDAAPCDGPVGRETAVGGGNGRRSGRVKDEEEKCELQQHFRKFSTTTVPE